MTTEQIEKGKTDRFKNRGKACQIINYFSGGICNRDTPIKVLFLGNSHEPDAFNFFHAGYGDNKDLLMINFGTLNRCKPMERVKDKWVSKSTECADRFANLMSAEFIRDIDYLVYSSRLPFGWNKKKSLEILQHMKKINPDLSILVYGGYFSTSSACAKLINQSGRAETCASPENVSKFENKPETEPLYKDIMKLADGYIDRVNLLCSDNNDVTTCLSATKGGIPVFYDQHHISFEFSEYSGKLYAKDHPDIFSK